MEEKKLWEKCVEFHGHECGGLAIGFKAALYARELLGLGRAEDEEVVCIAECDACPIDAIQVILGCTAGKGNLLSHHGQIRLFLLRAPLWPRRAADDDGL